MLRSWQFVSGGAGIALVLEAAMNVAGALARSLQNDGTPDYGLVVRLLIETASTQPALAIAGESENASGEANFFTAAGGISVEEVASRLMEPRLAELAQPVALDGFIYSGNAGIPQLTKDEVGEFLAEVTERDPGRGRSWLELAPIDDDGDFWVAYPQVASTSVEFYLILPAAQDAGSTRFLSLDPGVDVMAQTTHAPRLARGTGCDPGVSGLGTGLREVCLPAGCAGPCEGDWQVHRGRLRLTGCDCAS